MNPRIIELLRQHCNFDDGMIERFENKTFTHKEAKRMRLAIIDKIIERLGEDGKKAQVCWNEDHKLLHEAYRWADHDYCEHGRHFCKTCLICDWYENEEGQSVENEEDEPDFVPTHHCSKCSVGMRLSFSQVEDLEPIQIVCRKCSEEE